MDQKENAMAIEHHRTTRLDLAIIGGGPAGMSAALTAGRALVDTVVVNAESPRNAVTTASHGFLTRDGAHPSDIEQVYGTTVYPCVFCDGFEHHGERLALFGREGAIHYASTVALWTDDLVVFTNGEPIWADDAAAFARNGVQIQTGSICRLESKDGRLVAVEMESGERIERDAGFIADDYSSPSSDFAELLGVAVAENDWGMKALDASETGATKVAGLHVIGDARTGFSGLIAAAAEGAACAEWIVHEIATARWGDQ